MRIQIFICVAASILLCGSIANGIGRRHDVDADLYRMAGNNEKQFAAGERYPNLRSVVAIGRNDKTIESRNRRRRSKNKSAKDPFELMGSGTLVGPKHILTAAHVVLKSRFADGPVRNIRVRFGSDLTKPDLERTVTDVRFAASFDELRGFATRGKIGQRAELNAEFHDVAILVLDKSVDIPPAKVADSVPSIGSRLVLSGYGPSVAGNVRKEKRWPEPRHRNAAENILDRELSVNPFTEKADGGQLVFDFDDGSKERNTLNGKVRGWRKVISDGKSDAKPLPLEGIGYPGDSGGPAFARIDDKWQIVGVCTSGSGYPLGSNKIQYGDIEFYVRIPSHAAWIAKQLTD